MADPLRNRIAAALIDAAHHCFDADDAPISACRCEDPIYVSATTNGKASALDGSPEALADAVHAEVRLALTTWRADVIQAITTHCILAAHLLHITPTSTQTTCPSCQQIIRIIRGVDLPDGGETP